MDEAMGENCCIKKSTYTQDICMEIKKLLIKLESVSSE